MKSFRQLSLLLAVLALLAAFSGCSTPGNSGDITTPDAGISDTTPASDTTSPDESGDLVLVENGEALYSVMRYEDSTQTATDAALAIRRAIADITGITPGIVTDYKKKDTEYDPSIRAILVGTTRLEETAKVSSGMGYGEYRIQVCGNKLVVAAPLDGSVSEAAAELSAALAKFWDGSTLKIPADYSAGRVVDTQVNAIPVCTDARIGGIYDAGNGTKLLTLEGSSEEQYMSYCAEVAARGYEKYAEHAINGVLFSTFTSPSHYLNIVYCKPDKQIRISVDRADKTGLAPRAEDNVYTKKVSSSVTQIGCEISPDGGDIADRQIGMCYIFRLADGSFILEDGGFNHKIYADRIYNTLVELNGGPDNIVIAAWIFSHTHGDHIGAFRAFSAYYSNKVTVERFIYNNPTLAQYGESGSTHYGNYEKLVGCMSKFRGAERVIAHPGQVFHLRNATITTLFTYEMRIPATMDVFNSSSIVMRVEIEGQSFTLLGDLYRPENDLLARYYGKTLKCDFLQVAHHGAPGGTYNTNKLLDPVIVMWPLGEYDYFGVGKYNRSKEDYNKYFFDSTTVRQIIVAGREIVTLPLPYEFPDKLVLPVQK